MLFLIYGLRVCNNKTFMGYYCGCSLATFVFAHLQPNVVTSVLLSRLCAQKLIRAHFYGGRRNILYCSNKLQEYPNIIFVIVEILSQNVYTYVFDIAVENDEVLYIVHS